jgi:hypothetical protein
MPDTPKPLRYWGNAIRVSFEDTGKVGAITGGVSGMIVALISGYLRLISLHELKLMVIFTLIGVPAGLLAEFLIRLFFITPTKLSKIYRETPFEINGEECEIFSGELMFVDEVAGMERPEPTNCFLSVHNNSEDTVESVRVNVCSFVHPDFIGTFPPPKNLLATSSESHSIHPKSSLVYPLFDAAIFERDERDHKKNADLNSHIVSAAVRFPPGARAFAKFEIGKKYRIEIEAAGQNVKAKKQLFNLEFSGNESSCRFTLNKVEVYPL